jgi:Putative bacterial sensory transduction regulator
MQWWPRRDSGMSLTSTDDAPSRRRPSASEHVLRDCQSGNERRQPAREVRQTTAPDDTRAHQLVAEQAAPDDPASDDAVAPVTLDRLLAALDQLDIRYLTDGDGTILAMWERHVVLIALEGPDDEILMMRTRPHATVPRDWAERAYRVVNEWNHSRRFCKAYVGDPTDRGQLPIYAEVQVPLVSGVHEALLVELLDCGVSVSHGFVEWLHDDGCLL